MSAATHILTDTVVLPGRGAQPVGTGVSEDELSSSTWQWLNEFGYLKSADDIVSEAEGAPVGNGETVTLQMILADLDGGKKRKGDVAESLKTTVEQIDQFLTGENGLTYEHGWLFFEPPADAE